MNTYSCIDCGKKIATETAPTFCKECGGRDWSFVGTKSVKFIPTDPRASNMGDTILDIIRDEYENAVSLDANTMPNLSAQDMIHLVTLFGRALTENDREQVALDLLHFMRRRLK